MPCLIVAVSIYFPFHTYHNAAKACHFRMPKKRWPSRSLRLAVQEVWSQRAIAASRDDEVRLCGAQVKADSPRILDFIRRSFNMFTLCFDAALLFEAGALLHAS